MNLYTDIARRYLFSKKSTNAINIITGISVLGITIGTAALILILSVFNGFEQLIKDMVDNFNPDLKVIPLEGKRFEVSDSLVSQLLMIKGIDKISKTLEEVALFEYDGVQEAGFIKGVDDQFVAVTAIDSTIRQGQYLVKDGERFYGVPGYRLARNLSMNIDDRLTPINIYLPRRKKTNQLQRDFITREIMPVGFFSIESEQDHQYVITSLDLIDQMLKTKGSISALEIKLLPSASEEDVKVAISTQMKGVKIMNRYEQEETYFKVMKIEKWMSFLIGSLMIILIAFNIIGSLWMIVLDKKKDISILRSMGSTASQIKELFLKEGLFITLLGCLFGICLAILIYFIQAYQGIISMSGSHIVEAYPIELRFWDFVIVVSTVFFIGYLASILPAKKAAGIPALIREE